jgi:hypothetical protein
MKEQTARPIPNEELEDRELLSADMDYDGGDPPPEDPPPDPDKDYPGGGDQSFDGGQAAEEETERDPDKDYPPPSVAGNNGH